ncbi:response regulator [Heliobacillus mobilis]|uniref:Stage 0 sporulation protein A homolog n=2 Tax=Heliobacterium TaxID=2697 RepID=Q0PIF1_HELMO|nr:MULTISPECIES: response regulator [Heliobacterium]ABH04866.1 stand-alone receiver (REC) domain [Heliobacterium mobile]MBC9785300.1 response regulator [Heliobacterium chlorum]MTV49434.1 response regulator [Heliobacterium mobile]
MYPEIQILLVDDEEELVLSLQRILQLEGYSADYTTSPLTAIEKIKEKKYHIVLADIVMPEMDGIELLAALKAYDPLVQVIMMTGYSTMDKTVRCLEKGANDYLLKPFPDLDRVMEAVRLSEAKLRRWWESMRGNFA